MHLLFFTCGKHIFGIDNWKVMLAAHSRKILSSSLHRSIIFSVYIHRGIKGAVLANQSRDGEMISALLRRLGNHTPRGSSGRNKGGHLGLKAFVEYINKGNPGGIAVDATKEVIELYRQKLEERLLHLTYQADHWFDMRDTYPDPRDIPVPAPLPAPSLVL